MGKSSAFFIRECHGGCSLGKQRHNGGASVSADNWHFDCIDIEAFCIGNKGARPANIQGCDTHKLLWIIDALCLQHLSSNWHSRIHWVGDDENAGLGAGRCAASDEVLHDSCIDIEQIVTCHSGFSRHTCGNHHNIAATESLVHVITCVANTCGV